MMLEASLTVVNPGGNTCKSNGWAMLQANIGVRGVRSSFTPVAIPTVRQSGVAESKLLAPA
jgi:hypothetical protein